MSKWTVYCCDWPSLLFWSQKSPLVSVPVTSLLPTTCALSPKSPFWLSCNLTRKSACVVGGNGNRPIGLCGVALSSDSIFSGLLSFPQLHPPPSPPSAFPHHSLPL